jgi:DNA primase
MLETKPNIIPENKLREIRETCSIVEVISGYVSLKKIGSNYRGLCPFHNEKTPSFFVSDDRKYFNCFGCGTRGDVFTFLMKRENVSFKEAARLLAKRTGIYLPEKPLSPQQQKRLSEREQYFRINETTARYYNHLLLNDKRAEKARAYLKERGISLETIKDEDYFLGFAPEGWDSLAKHFRSKNISFPSAQKIGLVAAGKSDEHYYDRFRNRIIFPIFNVSRHIVGFGGRIIDKGEPKYLNSSESVIYSKRHNLYGLNAASRQIQKEGHVIIVEGYLDLLALHQAGIKNSVAALGTALTEDQIRILNKYSSDIIIVFDADPSGEKAMIKSLEPFLESDISARMVLLPQGDDPASFLQQHGQRAFREKIDGAGLLLDFVIEKIIQKNKIATPKGKRDACNEIGPLLKKISDEMERDLYVQKVCRRIGIKEDHFRLKMRTASKSNRLVRSDKQQSEIPLTSRENAEKLILKLMISHPETIGIIDRNSLLEEFTDTDLKELCRLLSRSYKQQGGLNLPNIMDIVEKESWKKIIAEDFFRDALPGDAAKILEDCIRNIRLKKNSRGLEKVNALLKQAEADRDESLSHTCQREHTSLLKEKKQILQFKLNVFQT